MRKRIRYRKGYRIQIQDGFYEVVDGRRVIHFGNCRKNSSIQEIANQTIDLAQEEKSDGIYNRRKRFRNEVAERVSERY